MTNLLHDLLHRSATKLPEHVAIEEKDAQISYRDLSEKAIQLGNLLNQSPAYRGARIGLLVHKSIAAYHSIYGILSAGCAYVPLDRRAPNERLAFIIDDCQIDTLVITRQNLNKLKQVLPLCQNIHRVVIVDSDEDALEDYAQITVLGEKDIAAQKAQTQQGFQIVDTDLAYILYTSGSTGQPKGVMINHYTAMSFVTWACEHTGLSSSDRVSAHAPLHFDLSVFDIYSTAMATATLCPVPDGASTFPARLLDWINDNRITVWYSVPSILSMMAQQKHFAETSFDTLRLIIFAGEVFPVPYLKMWLEKLPGIDFMNWFGPTETNVITSHTVTASAESIDKPLPIGKTTTNADLIIVDKEGNPLTEPGQQGEIYARGGCVALGYWGDKEKTAQRFISNPFKPWLSDRVFKTGDIVSFNADGEFTFQGRNDHLVKCRGYRIELGEVEAAFYQSSNVVEAVVIPIPDELIGNQLVACVVTKDSKEVINFDTEASETEKHLLNKLISQRLPSYMVPSETRLMNELPKTSNGKIDRQKLTQQIINN